MREFQCSNMVMELVREISRVDTKELARDSSGTRSYSLFLVELAERLVFIFSNHTLAIFRVHSGFSADPDPDQHIR